MSFDQTQIFFVQSGHIETTLPPGDYDVTVQHRFLPRPIDSDGDEYGPTRIEYYLSVVEKRPEPKITPEHVVANYFSDRLRDEVAKRVPEPLHEDATALIDAIGGLAASAWKMGAAE